MYKKDKVIFNRHPELLGKHALFGASSYHWLNYDDNKLLSFLESKRAVKEGTDKHEYAKMAIELGIRQRGKSTLSSYINDAIDYKMTPEQPLKYSDYCYGTADAISFRNGLLRIHDLKTGKIPANMAQLMIYAALFCLDNKVDPKTIKFELRIYQNDDVAYSKPEPEDIIDIIEKIKHAVSFAEYYLEGLKDE